MIDTQAAGSSRPGSQSSRECHWGPEVGSPIAVTLVGVLRLPVDGPGSRAV